MNTEPEVNFDAPATKPAKKANKRPSRKASRHGSSSPPKSGVPFPGLTRNACATACSEKGCVISGGIYCAHPTKGGLQAADQNDPAAKKRLLAAREQIAVKVDPNRFTD